MANETKQEKTGATAPATPSKVEGVQQPSASNDLHSENAGLKSDLQSKTELLQSRESDIQTLQTENAGLKSDLQSKTELLQSRESDIQTLQTENAGLKSENEDLKAKVADLEKKVESSKSSKKTKSEKRFIVVNSFRGNTKGDSGKVYNIGDDVSEFDAERLKNLVERELIKEV
ncbi:hypothetical protein [Sphingobacterium suaedae]|uniref:Uncharacterized protein n=1 Tax=Sphingobacterium suaedae TaxID=1686402 RepID=A0ABW5KG21_9SPHI